MEKKNIDWKKIINAILIVICLISIFAFSNMSGKTSNLSSEKVLEKIVEITNFDKKRDTAEFVKQYNQLFRKIAHSIEYMLLAILLMIFIDKYNVKVLKKFVIVLFICILCSMLDEFHQYFVDSRTASIMDCLIDTVGSLVGIGIYMLVCSIYFLIREVIKIDKERKV